MTEEQKKIFKQFIGFLFEALHSIPEDDPLLPVILLNLDHFTRQIITSFGENARDFQMRSCEEEFLKFTLKMSLGHIKAFIDHLENFEGSIFEDMYQELKSSPFESFINTLDMGEDSEG